MPETIKSNRTEAYSIHRMSPDEVCLAIEWAAAEGWNPGLHDAECFYLTDPQGFFIGKLNGDPVGCVSAVAYGDSFGFIGLYIVRPEFRGKGFGIPLWEMAMEYLGYRNIGLDGVIAQQDNYKKSGFQLAYRNLRYEGVIPGAPGSHIVPACEISLRCIQEYDRQCFPADRSRFLANWMKQPNVVSLACVEEGELRGYGAIRACRKGYKIGPLFADEAELADELFQALCLHAKGDLVYLDTPERNPAALELARRYGMSKMFETARMYTQEEPEMDLSKIYGITTFELG